MKTKQISPIGLSATGAGPKIFKPTSMVLVPGIIAGVFFPAVSEIPFLKTNVKTAGWVWLSIGIVLWISAVIQFIVLFPKGKLITTGVYALSRNPIYASWIIFVLPGLALVCNNWIFLISALVMLIAFLTHIKEEEMQMNEHFGDSYKAYVKKTGKIF